MEEPIVYMKQENPEGQYIGQDGKRYDILTCHHTESKEHVQVGTQAIIVDGEEVEVPIYSVQVVINKGWDSFNSLKEAMEEYGVEEYHEPVKEIESEVKDE